MTRIFIDTDDAENYEDIENYILFSCAGIDYECVDEELYMLTD